MNKIKLLATIGICGFILGGCGADKTSVNDSNTAEVAKSESVTVEEPGLDELDPSITNELAKIGSEDEEIDWEKVTLNKRQFKEYIESLDEQEAETSEETLTVVSSSMSDDNTIEIVINNSDTSEMSEFTNGFFAIMMDSLSRQLYLNSDYSDGSTHPTILIKDDEGNVISKETDFIEMEETE